MVWRGIVAAAACLAACDNTGFCVVHRVYTMYRSSLATDERVHLATLVPKPTMPSTVRASGESSRRSRRDVEVVYEYGAKKITTESRTPFWNGLPSLFRLLKQSTSG